MHDNNQDILAQKIKEYFSSIPQEIYSDDFKKASTVFLSGSTGWGIREGFDDIADWDLHIILEDNIFSDFISKYGADHIIDDHNHTPTVFGQIRSKSWLEERISKITLGDCLYTWIYNNGIFIDDPNNIKAISDKYIDIFNKNIEEFIRFHYVTFSVRRLDTVSSAKREIEVGARISNNEMAKAALQTISILNNKPYPYNKWLAKHVSRLGENGEKAVELATKSLQSTTLKEIRANAQNLKLFIEEQVVASFPDRLWVTEWWKFNQNPPEINIKKD